MMTVTKTTRSCIKNNAKQTMTISYDSIKDSAYLEVNGNAYSFICKKDVDEVVSELNFIKDLLKYDK